MSKFISDLELNDRVVAADANFGVGTLLAVAMISVSKQYLIGYKKEDARYSGAWSNVGKQWIKQMHLGNVSRHVNDYDFYWFVQGDFAVKE